MKIIFLILPFIILFSCQGNKNNEERYLAINDSIKKLYAPDKRVAIYNVAISSSKDYVLLQGESNLPFAVKKLKHKLKETGAKFKDSIVILPHKNLGDFQYGVINNSVANIRSKPKHSAELATQALLGTGIKVLNSKGSFYLVQVPDGYISWVDHGGFVLMNKNEYISWMEADKVIYTNTSGYVYQEEKVESKVLSDIVLGGQLNLVREGSEFFKVIYPDKRIGYIKKEEAALYAYWIENLVPSGELIERYALDFLGSPYLWGGTSTKGMDCSGFTKTAYLLNGLIIPRDASQQINAGENVDQKLNFKNLEKGDLMFFGTKASADNKEKVTHVGIWLGNDRGEFIHSARQVRISSINPDSKDYDEVNKNRYLGSRRYLGISDPMITNLKTDNIRTAIKP